MRGFFGAGIVCLALSACASPRTPVSSAVVWERAALSDTRELDVSPGDVLRIASDTPVRVVDITRGAEGEAEVARWVTPKNGVALVRPALGVSTMRFPRDVVVSLGTAKEPEISWFKLEHDAIAWAHSPLGTPFPALAAAPRLDPADAQDLDRTLSEARGRVDEDVVLAIRSVFALRTIHALEGLRAYPYARNEEITLSGEERTIDERTFYQLSAEHPARVTVSGPSALVVFSRAVRAPVDAITEVRVTEGGRLRGTSRATVRHLTPGEPPPPAATSAKRGQEEPDPTLALLRRVFVHVPPGSHTYQIAASGTPAWIAATETSGFLRVEDAIGGIENETHMLARARRACEPRGAGAPCAIALALAGEDGAPPFERALSNASPTARRLAERLATGAPADRAAALESDAAVGDTQALATVAQDAGSTIDPSLRDAWLRGTLRGTSWETVDAPEDGGAAPDPGRSAGDGSELTWFAFLPRGAAGSTCAASSHPSGPVSSAPVEQELDARPTTAFALPWRRVKTVRLLAVAPCSSNEPIRVEVDGQTLVAQPGSPRSVWHVVVRGETARVRRLDRGPGHVYVLSDDGCSGHGTLVHPALPLGAPRTLRFPAGVSAAGVEVWVAEGAGSLPFVVESEDGKNRVEVSVHGGTGMTAIDEKGARWRRVASVALPAWATRGVRASGPAGVALRPVARGVKGDAKPELEHARPADVDALVAISRKLTAATTRPSRGAAFLERALLLASYGFEHAAMDDAELAKADGATGPRGEDPRMAVSRAVLPAPPTPLELSENAYGVEPDFDPKAARCAVRTGTDGRDGRDGTDGPRARIANLDVMLRQRGKSAPFDRALATKAAGAALDAPEDPRSETLVTLATSSSKWRLLHDVEGGGGRVPRPHEKDKNPVIDASGRLKPHILAGDPFGSRFVSVTSERLARAYLGDIADAKAHLDVVCVPRRPTSDATCPLKVISGDVRVDAHIDAGGRATVDLPPGRGRGKGAELEVSLPETDADFVALMRVVLDRRSPGTTYVEGLGWVLDTPSIQYRFLLAPGRPIRIRPAAPGLLRVDALPESGAAGGVLCTLGDRNVVVPPTGEPKVLPVTKGGEVVISARGGVETVAIAERIEAESRPETDWAARNLEIRQLEFRSARTSLESGSFRDVAESSPPPLTWLEDRIGTFESNSGGVAQTLRDGASARVLDAYGFESITYRRRIESINLYTLGSVLARVRDGQPTYGASASLYEDIESLRLRVTGTAGVLTQNVDGTTAYNFQPRGFIEYSGRLASDLFLLPRLGYDGNYSSLKTAPASARDVDDDIYNAFRFHRNTFAFLQGLLWYVPFFNDIFYLRARGTYDATNGAFSHASLRPGAFFIFHAVELSAYFDAQYFLATTGARAKTSVDGTAGGGIVLHLPVAPGSFEIRPNASGAVRDDGGWQVIAGISLVASFRRGVRDYSSLELSYPEETSGGIPWRSESRTP